MARNGHQTSLQVLFHFRAGYLPSCQHLFGLDPHTCGKFRTHPLFFILPSTDLVRNRQSTEDWNTCVHETRVATEMFVAHKNFPEIFLTASFFDCKLCPQSSRRPFHFVFPTPPFTPDGIVACDHVLRSATLGTMPAARSLLPFVRRSYAQQSCYQWFDDAGRGRRARTPSDAALFLPLASRTHWRSVSGFSLWRAVVRISG